MEISLSEDEEIQQLLKDMLKKPMKWHEERAERAVRAAIAARGGANIKRRSPPATHRR
jgi:hypothetical protein